MSWFKNHLNWTATFGILLGLLFSILAREFENDFLWALAVAVLLVISTWVLRQKRRTLWWLLILFVPLGWPFFIVLQNRSEVIDNGWR